MSVNPTSVAPCDQGGEGVARRHQGGGTSLRPWSSVVWVELDAEFVPIREQGEDAGLPSAEVTISAGVAVCTVASSSDVARWTLSFRLVAVDPCAPGDKDHHVRRCPR